MYPHVRALLRKDFYAFVRKAFADRHPGSSLDDSYIEYVCYELAKIATGKIDRAVVNVPPRHLKTFVGSTWLPAYILGRDPSARIMVVSYGENLAREIAQNIRGTMKTEWYKELFKTRIAKDRSRAMDFATTQGGGVRAFSIEGGITGFGADYIIVDDPLEIKDADNTAQIDHVSRLFDETIRSRLNDPNTGRIVIIAHRLNTVDLSGHVLKEDGWHHIALPFIATRNTKFRIGDEVWKRKKGELLRPHPEPEVKRIRKLGNFETLYQQNPTGGLPRLTANHFSTVDPSAVEDSPVVLSIDPGQELGEKNSFGVIQVWRPRGNEYFLQDQWRARASYKDLKFAAKQFIRSLRPSAVLIEKVGAGLALLSDIEPRSWMSVVPVVPRDSKTDRLRRHAATIQARKISLPANAPWRNDFVQEFIDFPGGKFTDQVDATTQFLDFMALSPVLLKPPARALGGAALGSAPQPAPSTPMRGIVVAPGKRFF
jgi:predicted phage terminase large subunit-like protein